MAPGILVERDGVIATVILSNPDKLNAITVAMWRDLARVMGVLSGDETLRCVVLRGAGDKAFAAGADIEENFAYFDTEDYRIGMQAFLNKKKAKFVGR